MSMLRDIEHNVSYATDEQDMTDLLDWCMDADNDGSHYPGMTYEQGIRAVLDWLAGESDNPPHRE